MGNGGRVGCRGGDERVVELIGGRDGGQDGGEMSPEVVSEAVVGVPELVSFF